MSLSDRHLFNLWHVIWWKAWDWTVIFLYFQLVYISTVSHGPMTLAIRHWFCTCMYALDSHKRYYYVLSRATAYVPRYRYLTVLINVYWLTHVHVPGCVTAERYLCIHVYIAYSDTNHYYLRDFLHLNNVNFITQSSLNSHRASQRLSISVK